MQGSGDQTSKASLPILVRRPVGLPKTSILKDRIEPFYTSGQYDKVNLLDKMYKKRPSFKDATSHDFKETSTGATFGPSWSTHWFRIHLTVPEDILHEELLVLEWDADNEGLIWTEDGIPLQGLTGGGERIEWRLPESFRDASDHVIYIEMACSQIFGNAAPGKSNIAPPDENRVYTLNTANITAIDNQARMLYFDISELGGAARELPEDSAE
ncbi:Glycoside hydrolase, 38 vacuolar alpha mannosidase [Conoideocrella luteorostrata]|uniref:Glycoside hydrolase, 38 vacuolar alpha mannosidase n=1 Tax=Conoideocrella luteorostrata TaxID=1105319 RepID=A0AAJ0CHU8_9HYPO|nr:Glycoside hydrolase, 38 vacuolar alpha mannosidase [Conoideocrella luteorostrata]